MNQLLIKKINQYPVQRMVKNIKTGTDFTCISDLFKTCQLGLWCLDIFGLYSKCKTDLKLIALNIFFWFTLNFAFNNKIITNWSTGWCELNVTEVWLISEVIVETVGCQVKVRGAYCHDIQNHKNSALKINNIYLFIIKDTRVITPTVLIVW